MCRPEFGAPRDPLCYATLCDSNELASPIRRLLLSRDVGKDEILAESIKLCWPECVLISHRGGSGGGAIGAIAQPKTYESNFFHHDFVQFGKRNLTANWDWTAKYYWNRPPLNLRAGSAPVDAWQSSTMHANFYCTYSQKIIVIFELVITDLCL